MPPYPMVSFPDRWASWGLPEDLVEGIFAAATRFHAAKPWAHLSNTEVLELAFPDGGRPTACVMGSAGLEFGLVLYDELDDFVRLIDADGEYFPAPKGSVVTLEFVPKGEVSRGMRREIMTGKWPLPAGDAYPRILALNTPAGGLSRARAEMLRLALDAVARFVTEREADIVRHSVSDPPLEWLHAESGVTVIFAGDIDHEISMFDAPVVRLHGGGASGPGADPEDFARGEGEGESLWERDRAVVAEFDRALAEGQGGRRPLAQATARFHAMIAGAFVDCLCGHHGAGLGAVHEYDLRVFLYDWFPRKVSMGRTDAFRVPVSLGKFFRFLADEKGIVCRWASWILDDRELFEERWAAFPGGFWWDAPVIDWRSELRPDLDARVLVPSGDLVGLGSWGATMGVREAQLFGELSRRWLAWREEVIAGGVVDPADVRRILGERQRAWELAPHARHGGASPSAVVQRERSATRRTRPPNVIP